MLPLPSSPRACTLADALWTSVISIAAAVPIYTASQRSELMLTRALLMALAIAIGSLGVSASAWAADSPSAAVPERVAALIRPILDLRQRSIVECGASEKTQECATGVAYERQQNREERI